MSDYEFVYDHKTRLTTLKHYVGGCGSVNGYSETTAQFKLDDAIQLRDELNDCIVIMQEDAQKVKEENKQKLIKEKEELLLRISEVQNKLNKGDY